MQCFVSVPRMLGLLLLGIGMTALGYWVAMRASGTEKWAGWFCVVFFGIGCVVILRQTFRRDAIITLDAEGIESNRVGKEKILWAQVAAVSIGTIQRQKMLCIHLKDEDAYVAGLSATRRAVARSNKALGFPAISVSFQGLKPGLDEALAYIESHLAERR